MRVSIEDRLFGEGRLFRVAKTMGWSPPMVVGTLAYLWHESQNARRESGDAHEIITWSWIEDQAEGSTWVLALLKSGFLSQIEGSNQLLIHGNKKHIDNLNTYAERGKRGGVASGISRREAGASKIEAGASEIEAPASKNEAESKLSEAIALHSITLHSSSSHSITSQEEETPASVEAEPPPKFTDEDLSIAEAWLEYALEQMPWRKDAWKTGQFAEDVALLRRRSKLNSDQLMAVLKFVAEDEFWRDKACSPKHLLDKSKRNGQRKIDNILLAMKSKSRSGISGTAQAIQQWAEEN